MKRTIYGVDTNLDPQKLVTFEMKGDKLVAEWFDADFREMLEGMRIFAAGGKSVTIADGKAFFDALPAHYNRASFYSVEDE